MSNAGVRARELLASIAFLGVVGLVACGGEAEPLAPVVVIDDAGQASCAEGPEGFWGGAAAAYRLEDHHRVLATYRYRLLSDPSAPPKLEQLDVEWQRESPEQEGAWASLARLRIRDAARIESGRTYDLGPQLANAGAADLDILTRTGPDRPPVRSGRAFVRPGSEREELVEGCLDAELGRGVHEDDDTSLRGTFAVTAFDVVTLD